MSQQEIDLVNNIIYVLRHNKSLREKFLETLNDTEEHKETSTIFYNPLYQTKPNGSL